LAPRQTAWSARPRAELQFQGFLTNGRNGKGVVFHIQDFKPI